MTSSGHDHGHDHDHDRPHRHGEGSHGPHAHDHAGHDHAGHAHSHIPTGATQSGASSSPAPHGALHGGGGGRRRHFRLAGAPRRCRPHARRVAASGSPCRHPARPAARGPQRPTAIAPRSARRLRQRLRCLRSRWIASRLSGAFSRRGRCLPTHAGVAVVRPHRQLASFAILRAAASVNVPAPSRTWSAISRFGRGHRRGIVIRCTAGRRSIRCSSLSSRC